MYFVDREMRNGAVKKISVFMGVERLIEAQLLVVSMQKKRGSGVSITIELSTAINVGLRLSIA